MKKIILIIFVVICISTAHGNYSFWAVIDNWLTDNEVGDFNEDGIVNFKDFSLISAYGSDEYGLDNYGN